MQAMPVGVPKLMVSTLASGNVSGFVGPTDICMMHAVVDVAGSERHLASGHRQCGPCRCGHGHAEPGGERQEVTARPVGLTMFGVTTPCVTQIRQRIEPQWESFVFHATGTGGQSFEKLADSGFLDAVHSILPRPKWQIFSQAELFRVQMIALVPSSAIPSPMLAP